MASARYDQAMWPRPNSCATSLHAIRNAFDEAECPIPRHSTCANCFDERGLLTARKVPFCHPVRPRRETAASPASSGIRELAFLRDPLKSLNRAFDPILAIVALVGKLSDHL